MNNSTVPSGAGTLVTNVSANATRVSANLATHARLILDELFIPLSEEQCHRYIQTDPHRGRWTYFTHVHTSFTMRNSIDVQDLATETMPAAPLCVCFCVLVYGESSQTKLSLQKASPKRRFFAFLEWTKQSIWQRQRSECGVVAWGAHSRNENDWLWRNKVITDPSVIIVTGLILEMWQKTRQEPLQQTLAALIRPRRITRPERLISVDDTVTSQADEFLRGCVRACVFLCAWVCFLCACVFVPAWTINSTCHHRF